MRREIRLEIWQKTHSAYENLKTELDGGTMFISDIGEQGEVCID